jgi:ABC-type antimicrobial peptide transport system permease subunit
MPGASYVTVTPLSEIISHETESWTLGATMFLIFGTLALMLAAIGLYSVVAYSVAQRTPELGIRTALGAQFGDVIRLVLGEGMALGLIGIAIGVALALLGSRWVGPLLFNESPRDPVVFGGVALVLLGVAALASYIPALRATRVDPVVALRTE